MAASPSGWALRKNGTCELQEVDCGETVAPYRVCCPHASSCPRQYNVNVSEFITYLPSTPHLHGTDEPTAAQCCPTSANCTTSLIPNPSCANQTWDLYDNDGYFCCLPGHLGYAAKDTGSNGCASPGYKLQFGEVLLRLIKAGVPAGSDDATSTITTSPPSSATTQTTSTITSSPVSSGPAQTPSATAEKGLSTGATVGIGIGAAVGGIILLVLAFFFFRRKRTGQGKQREVSDTAAPTGQVPAGPALPSEEASKSKELDGQGVYVAELGGGHHIELEGDNHYRRAEVQG